MFWIAWSRGALQILTFATTLLVARILAPADYGVMAIATFFTATAGTLAEMGVDAGIGTKGGKSKHHRMLLQDGAAAVFGRKWDQTGLASR